MNPRRFLSHGSTWPSWHIRVFLCLSTFLQIMVVVGPWAFHPTKKCKMAKLWPLEPPSLFQPLWVFSAIKVVDLGLAYGPCLLLWCRYMCVCVCLYLVRVWEFKLVGFGVGSEILLELLILVCIKCSNLSLLTFELVGRAFLFGSMICVILKD